MSQSTWTTKDGTVVPIVGMTDGHLLNTIRYLVRRAKSLRLQAPDPTRIGEDERDVFATMVKLAVEAKARGLDKAGPGPGVGGRVIRKDVFEVEEC